MYGVGAHSRWTVLLPGLVVCGIGIGFANPAIGHLALAVVPPHRAGMASEINNTFRIGGITIGVAALGALLQSRVAARIPELLPTAPHGLAAAVASGGTRRPPPSPGRPTAPRSWKLPAARSRRDST